MNQPILSILIPALYERVHNLDKLIHRLKVDISSWGLEEFIEILVELDITNRRTSGRKRQLPTNRATGKYIAFIDDDDMVVPNYIHRLVEACKYDTDVVTFDLLLKNDHNRVIEQWKFRLGEDDRNNLTMAANHLCAWKKEVATRVGWCPHLGYGDDQLWYKPLQAAYPNLIEFHIAEPLYVYNYSPVTTANQTKEQCRIAYQYAGNGLRCFLENKYHPKGVYIQAGHESESYINPEGVEVQPCDHLILQNEVTRQPFYTVEIK